MNRWTILLMISLAGVLAGCSTSTEPAASTEGNATTTPTTAEASAPKNDLPAGVHIAKDNVVRDADGKAYCVVMKQVVELPESEAEKAVQDGVTYYFCCKSCPRMFAKDPSKYAVAKN